MYLVLHGIHHHHHALQQWDETRILYENKILDIMKLPRSGHLADSDSTSVVSLYHCKTMRGRRIHAVIRSLNYTTIWILPGKAVSQRYARNQHSKYLKNNTTRQSPFQILTHQLLLQTQTSQHLSHSGTGTWLKEGGHT